MFSSRHDVAKNGSLQKQAGFTLIELLIVIAIIAILAAIAIPQFLKYKQGAYIDSVRSDIKNVATAYEAYAAKYGSYPGSASFSTAGPQALSSESDAVNISNGNTIWVTMSSDNNGSPCYDIKGTNSNVASFTAEYNQCTGSYTNF